MTNQQAYDKAKKHLLKQMEHSRDGFGQCLYRTTEKGRSLSCSIGVLIPRRAYHPIIEGLSMLDLATRTTQLCADDLFLFEQILCEAGLDECDAEFLVELQAVHDDTLIPEYFEESFTDLANRWNLKK